MLLSFVVNKLLTPIKKFFCNFVLVKIPFEWLYSILSSSASMVDRATLDGVAGELMEGLALPLRRFWTGDSTDESVLPTSVVWLLGKSYGPFRVEEMADRYGEYQKFLRDLKSRPWITYRSGFEPIKSTTHTSDSGWGCMLRSGQMLLAQVLFRHVLTDEWRLGHNMQEVVLKYSQILSWFLDQDSPNSPFSIHRIAIEGKRHDKEIGQWFGPATIAAVLKTLVQDYRPYGLNAYVAQDGVVYKDRVIELARTPPPQSSITKFGETHVNGFHSILILVPLRLGLDFMNDIYEPALKNCFRFPQSVGIAGGRPNSSLYFVAADEHQLFFLDPHITRPAMEIKPLPQCTEEDWRSFHCPDVRRIDIARIDPSLLLGFYCKSEADLDDFCRRVEESNAQSAPIFSVATESPVYVDDVDLAVDDEDDGNDFDLL